MRVVFDLVPVVGLLPAVSDASACSPNFTANLTAASHPLSNAALRRWIRLSKSRTRSSPFLSNTKSKTTHAGGL